MLLATWGGSSTQWAGRFRGRLGRNPGDVETVRVASTSLMTGPVGGLKREEGRSIIAGYPTPVDIAVAFTQAWTSHDMATAARYVADDVVESPMTQITGAKAYLESAGVHISLARMTVPRRGPAKSLEGRR